MSKNKKSYHIIVGSNLPTTLAEVLEEKLFTVSKQADEDVEIKTIQLENLEIKQVVENRIKAKEFADVKTYLQNEDEKADARKLAEKFLNMVKPLKEGHMTSLSYVKNQTNFSWSKFNTVIDTLHLFGFVRFDEDRKYMQIKLEDEDLIENTLEKINSEIERLNESIEYARTVINDSKVKKKLYNYKRKLSLIEHNAD